jgi:hypothetical protein
MASVALFAAYVLILTALESFGHAIQQFAQLWYLMAPLITGFGVQIGLFSYVRTESRRMASGGATGSVAASGGVSAGSMVLCCLHHVTDVLPLIGLSAAALFLAQYQVFFLVLGVLSNIIGIFMMLNIMQRNGLHPNTNIFSGIFRYNMFRVRNRMIIASVVILAIVLAVSMFPAQGSSVSMTGGANTDSSGVINLQTLTNNENMVTIDVTPVDFEFGNEAVFDISLNTHQGDLGYWHGMALRQAGTTGAGD